MLGTSIPQGSISGGLRGAVTRSKVGRLSRTNQRRRAFTTFGVLGRDERGTEIKTHSWQSDREFAAYLRHLTHGKTKTSGNKGLDHLLDPKAVGLTNARQSESTPAQKQEVTSTAENINATVETSEQIKAFASGQSQESSQAKKPINERNAFFAVLLKKLCSGSSPHTSTAEGAEQQTGYATRALAIVRSELSASKFAQFVEACDHSGMQEPWLREAIALCPAIIQLHQKSSTTTGSSSENFFHNILRAAAVFGRNNLYPGDVLDFVTQEHMSLGPLEMSLLLQETGRHGLRAKHLADSVVHRAAELVRTRQMTDLREVLRCCEGLCRFTRDWQIFFHSSAPLVRSNLLRLDTKDLLLVLRFSRELRQTVPLFLELQRDACSLLKEKTTSETARLKCLSSEAADGKDLGEDMRISIADAIRSLQDVPFDKRFARSVGDYVCAVEELLFSYTQGKSLVEDLDRDPNFGNTVDLVRAFDALTSWSAGTSTSAEGLEASEGGGEASSSSGAPGVGKIEDQDSSEHQIQISTTQESPCSRRHAVQHFFGSLFAHRIAEIKYSANVSLFQSITQSLSRVGHFHQEWMEALTPVVRDKYMLDRISFFQQCTLLASLAKLRFRDDETYESLAFMLWQEKELFKEIEHISPVVWSLCLVHVESLLHAKNSPLEHLSVQGDRSHAQAGCTSTTSVEEIARLLEEKTLLLPCEDDPTTEDTSSSCASSSEATRPSEKEIFSSSPQQAALFDFALDFVYSRMAALRSASNSIKTRHQNKGSPSSMSQVSFIALTQCCWSFVLAGYHRSAASQRQQKTCELLDAVFTRQIMRDDPYSSQAPKLERLSQIAHLLHAEGQGASHDDSDAVTGLLSSAGQERLKMHLGGGATEEPRNMKLQHETPTSDETKNSFRLVGEGVVVRGVKCDLLFVAQEDGENTKTKDASSNSNRYYAVFRKAPDAHQAFSRRILAAHGIDSRHVEIGSK
ncbi:unnamed protein product [Amoebophrya sp. A25]|nr:unnamed protein product [Amoebophrya sp. A25]|eukprot:GSA25T00026883001.1